MGGCVTVVRIETIQVFDCPYCEYTYSTPWLGRYILHQQVVAHLKHVHSMTSGFFVEKMLRSDVRARACTADRIPFPPRKRVGRSGRPQ